MKGRDTTQNPPPWGWVAMPGHIIRNRPGHHRQVEAERDRGEGRVQQPQRGASGACLGRDAWGGGAGRHEGRGPGGAAGQAGGGAEYEKRKMC